jgi:hypothetical protein
MSDSYVVIPPDTEEFSICARLILIGPLGILLAFVLKAVEHHPQPTFLLYYQLLHTEQNILAGKIKLSIWLSGLSIHLSITETSPDPKQRLFPH